MTNSKPIPSKRLAPLSIRLTDQERDYLTHRSGGLPLSTYVKSVLFCDNAPQYRATPKSITFDRKAIAGVLGVMGRTGIARNLAELSAAAQTGNLYFDDETKSRLLSACADIREMRNQLLHALGKRG